VASFAAAERPPPLGLVTGACGAAGARYGARETEALTRPPRAWRAAVDDDAIRKIGDLLAKLAGPTGPANLCPGCGAAMEYRDGMHCSGRDERGRRWTGGVDWAFCQPCQQWFKMVHGPNHPPPRPWEACEGPGLFGE